MFLSGLFFYHLISTLIFQYQNTKNKRENMYKIENNLNFLLILKNL